MPDREEFERWHTLFDTMMRQYCPGRDSALELSCNLIAYTMGVQRLNLVDLGSGSGWFVRAALDRFPHARAWAFDRSALALRVGQELDRSGRVTWTQGDLGSDGLLASLPQGEIDVVFSGWASHEIRELGPFYERAARCLRPGGVLLNVDFMGGLEAGFGEMAERLTSWRVTGEWRALSREFEKKLEIAEGELSSGPETRWITYYSPETHHEALIDTGFGVSEMVWRYLNSAMVMAVH